MIYVINGVNLGMLGIREPSVYGSKTLAQLEQYVADSAAQLKMQVQCFQSDFEGEIVQLIHRAYYEKAEGIIINAGAYTHTSVAILDALRAVAIPTVEVHLSDINAREEFRRRSYVSLYAQKVICGKGFEGYREALRYFARKWLTAADLTTPRTYALSDNKTGGKPYNDTQVTFYAEKDSIILHFVCRDSAPVSFGENYNDLLYNGDIVEAMLTLGKPNYYLELEVNPKGAEYCVLIDNKSGVGDIGITFVDKAPFSSTVATVEGGWTADITLSVTALKELGFNPQCFSLNLYRQDFDVNGTLQLYALSPTYTPSFHVAEAYLPATIG